MAAKKPVPLAVPDSRMTAARFAPGAISLSSSSHFVPMLNSNRVNPVKLPPDQKSRPRDEPRMI
jgi:hypothetical protein